MTEWFKELLYPFYAQSIRIDRWIFRGKTKFQKVAIFENEGLGRVLCLDGVVQTSEADEFYYHEMLTHPAMMAHGHVKDVLIIGGADGGVLREVLKHPIRKAVLVDIDDELIELCRTLLPTIWAGAGEDPRTVNAPGDGVKFVAETKDKFDLIIVDSTDPMGPGEGLFRLPFFRNCQRILRKGGLVVTQNGVPFYQPAELRAAHDYRAGVFERAGYYLTEVPLYAGAHMALGWASDTLDFPAVPPATIRKRYAARNLNTRYYNPAIHGACFAIPNHFQAIMYGPEAAKPKARAKAAKPKARRSR